jgi:hypothetical protein
MSFLFGVCAAQSFTPHTMLNAKGTRNASDENYQNINTGVSPEEVQKSCERKTETSHATERKSFSASGICLLQRETQTRSSPAFKVH